MTFDEACQALADEDYAAAAEGFAKSLEARPYEAQLNLGQALRCLGDPVRAEAAFRQAIALRPADPDGLYCLSELCLEQGRFAEGWALFDARRWWSKTKALEPPRAWPQLACPEWKGEDLRGKHLLVFGEQGFGDQIQFARYLPFLASVGASCSFVCAPALASLYPDGWPRTQPLPSAHYWVLAMSLPRRLELAAPPPPRRVTPPIRLTSEVRIGVVPTGSPTHSNDARRSLHGADAAALLALGRDLRPEATGARSFLHTAAIVAGLDLVISVDTSVAHLAASMGKPTWVLLAHPKSDWRWLRGREDSPWYPSVRLFRQTRPGDWNGVLERVRAALGAPPGRNAAGAATPG